MEFTSTLSANLLLFPFAFDTNQDTELDATFTRDARDSALCVTKLFVDGRVAGHLGAAVGLKTHSIHVCVCPHFGM